MLTDEARLKEKLIEKLSEKVFLVMKDVLTSDEQVNLPDKSETRFKLISGVIDKMSNIIREADDFGKQSHSKNKWFTKLNAENVHWELFESCLDLDVLRLDFSCNMEQVIEYLDSAILKCLKLSSIT